MPNELPDASIRRRSLLLCAGTGLLGAAVVCLSATSIIAFVAAILRRDPIIEWEDGGFHGLPIGLALLALALGLFIGRNHGPNLDGWRSDAIRRLLMLCVGLLVCAMALPLGIYGLVGHHLEARGYNECLPGLWIGVGRVPDVPETPPECRGLSSGPVSQSDR